MSDGATHAATVPPEMITRSQLPLHCPTPAMSHWDSHPQVYLPLGEKRPEGEVTAVRCPYCGAAYRLGE